MKENLCVQALLPLCIVALETKTRLCELCAFDDRVLAGDNLQHQKISEHPGRSHPFSHQESPWRGVSKRETGIMAVEPCPSFASCRGWGDGKVTDCQSLAARINKYDSASRTYQFEVVSSRQVAERAFVQDYTAS